MLSNKKQFIFNLFSNYGNIALSTILNFISVPLILNYWDNELYGVWTIITSFATYISVSGLGIDTATGILATKNSNLNIKKSIIKKGTTFLLFTSLFIFFVFIIINIIFPNWITLIGNMEPQKYEIAKKASIVFFLGLIINLPFSAISQSLQSIGKAHITTNIGLFQTILNFTCVLLTIFLRLTLPIYVLLTSSVVIMTSLLKVSLFIIFYKKEYKNAQIKNLDIINKEENNGDNSYKKLLSTGINMSLYGLILMIIPNISNLIISNNIDVKSLVPYSLSFKLYNMLTGLWCAVNVSLAPIIGQECGKNNWDKIREYYNKSFIITLSISAFTILGVIWGSKPFITLWTGNSNNYVGNFISIILGLYFFLNSFNNIHLTFLNSMNYVNKIWIISWAEGIFFIIFSLVSIKYFGIASVPLGLFFSLLLFSNVGYYLILRKRTNYRIEFNYKFLLKIIIVLMISIIFYLMVSKINISLINTILIDSFFILLNIVMIYIILPKEYKNQIKIMFKKKIRR